MTTTNKVIKECIICRKSFEDRTRPKNKKTCSRKCADEARKARQREDYRKKNPPKPNQRQLYYYDHYEYSFWVGDGKEGDQERIANNQTWKHVVPYDTDKVEQISAAIQSYDLMGGRKKQTGVIDYNGDEKGNTKTTVHFVEHNREPGEVVEYKMTPEELEEYRKSRGK